jgi:hypothetical protein
MILVVWTNNFVGGQVDKETLARLVFLLASKIDYYAYSVAPK